MKPRDRTMQVTILVFHFIACDILNDALNRMSLKIWLGRCQFWKIRIQEHLIPLLYSQILTQLPS